MVFCYKTLTGSPTRSGLQSRTRSPSPMCRVPIIPSSISEFIGSLDYEGGTGYVLNAIPDHDWRVIAALARKRERDDEQQRLADEFHKIWLQEKKQREMVEAKASHQYKKYIGDKRKQEKELTEHKRTQRWLEEQLKTGQLVTYIKRKEQRSANLLAMQDGIKATEIIEKAVESDVKSQLAAERRLRKLAADNYRRKVDLATVQRRLDEATMRRDALIKDAAQRAAISNVLSNWESSLIRQEVQALEAARSAHHAAKVAVTEARSARVLRAKEKRQKLAKKIAIITQNLREAVREGRW